MTSLISTFPMTTLQPSVAHGRGRRHNSRYPNPTISSGQSIPQPPANSIAAGIILGQPSASSGHPLGIISPGSGFPQGSQVQNSSQQGGASAVLTTLGSNVSGVSSGGPGLPSCLSSGSSSGVMSGGSRGCLSSSGTPSQNHIPAGQQTPSSLPTPPTLMNFNSYGKNYSPNDPSVLPILQPIDKALRPRFDEIMSTHSSTDPVPHIASLLRAYGLQTFKVKTAAGEWSPDPQSYDELITHLLAVRAGTSALPGLTSEIQQQLYLMAGLTVKDLDHGTLAQCASKLSDKYLHPLEAVATRPITAWQTLAKGDLQALLGILGYPFPTTATKAQLLDFVPIAQRLVVYQGHLIPQILDPYQSITLPTSAVLDITSPAFRVTLADALMDPTQIPPTEQDCKQFILDYPGTTADMEVFDHSIWSYLPSPHDRRVFLSMFGIPLDLTVALSADDLLPLLPKDLPASVPVTKATAVTASTERRTRLMQRLVAASQVAHLASALPPLPTPALVNRPTGPAGTQSPITSPVSQGSPVGRNPLAVLPGQVSGQPYPAFTPLPARFTPQAPFTAATSALPGFTPVCQAVSGLARTVPTNGRHDEEVRTFVDPSGTHVEASQGDLAMVDTRVLHDWVAHLEGVHSAQVPNLPVQSMVNRIWRSSSTPGFRTLLAQSPACAQHHGYVLTSRCWPDSSPLPQVLLLTEKFGRPIQAVYKVDPPVDLFTPTTARLVSGDATVFPPLGQLHYGDIVLTPDTSDIQILPQSVPNIISGTVPAATTSTQLSAIAAVSDTIGKTQRSAKSGTRVLKDEVMDPTYLALVSATPVESGNKMFHHTLYQLLQTQRHFIQCPLQILVNLSRGFTDHNPNHFIPLSMCMDETTAGDVAKVFLKAEHRNENKFTGKIEQWWNNQPEALLRSLLSIFQAAHALFNYHPTIYEELKLVAQRMYMIANSLPDRPLSNNTWFWGEVLDQVNDVFLGASAEHTTHQAIVIALRTLPNFTTKESAYQKLNLLKTEAFKRREARTASQLPVFAKDVTSDDAETVTPGQDLLVTVRTSPRRVKRSMDRTPGYDQGSGSFRNRKRRNERSDGPGGTTREQSSSDYGTHQNWSRDRNRGFQIPREHDARDRQRHVVFPENPVTTATPVTKSSCAHWCSTSGCNLKTCSFTHAFPPEGKAARRIRALITQRQLTPRPELEEICGQQEQATTGDAPSTAEAETGPGPATHPPRRGKVRGGMLRGTGTREDLNTLIASISVLDSSNSWKVSHEPDKGDCGPGMVFAIIRLICLMYPQDFDSTRSPRYPSDVRARLAYLLIRDLHLSAQGFPDDDWHSLFVQDPHETGGVGQLPRDVINPRHRETPYNHRVRIAEYVAYGETSFRRPDRQGVFWFTSQVAERLIRHYIEDMFVYREGVNIEGWLHTMHADKAHVAIGPICIACLDTAYDSKILSPTTSWLYERNFQFIGLATGNHFVTYLNRRHIPIPGMSPVLPFSVGEWCRSIFRDGSLVWQDPTLNDWARELIRTARGRAPQPGPYTISNMSVRFPMIHDFLLWDVVLHPFRTSDNSATFFPDNTRLLPAYARSNYDYYQLVAEDIFQHEHGPLSLYAAFVDKDRKFCRALYDIESFDIVQQKWLFFLTATNSSIFPHEVYLPPARMVIAIRTQKVALDHQQFGTLFDGDVPPEVRAFWDPPAPAVRPDKPPERNIVVGKDVQYLTCHSIGLLQHSKWRLAVGAHARYPAKPGLFAIAEDGASELQAWTILLTDVFLESSPPTSHPDFNRESAVQIQITTDLRFISRDQYDALPFRIRPGRYSNKSQLFNCGWIAHPTRSNCYNLELRSNLASSSELLVEPAWFDEPPDTLPLPVRQDLLMYGRNEMRKYATTPVLQQHVLALARGIPYREREFKAYFDEIPDPTVLATVEGDKTWPPTYQENLDKQERRRAKQARRKQRQAQVADQARLPDGETEDSLGWTAITEIAKALRTNDSLFDQGFEDFLAKIKKEYTDQTDFTDDSPIVQEMLTKQPPELLQLEDETWEIDEKDYREGGLHHLYSLRAQKLKFRGLPRLELLDWLERRAQPFAQRIVRLLTEGQETCMIPSYKPNGGYHGNRPIVNNGAYHSARHVIENDYVKLWKQRRAVIIREPMMRPEDLLTLHLHTIFAVPNPGKLCRIVVHMSKGTRTSPSYNESVDMNRHLSLYPRDPLPTLHTYADWLHSFRQKFPHYGYLHAAIVDAKSAFQQFPLSFEKFKLVWMRLQIQRDAEWIHLLVGHVVGTFGDIGAGDTWGLIAACLQHIHNLVSELWRSLTYVDDMAIIAAPVPYDQVQAPRKFYNAPRAALPPKIAPGLQPLPPDVHYAIFEAVIEARDNLAMMFGMESSEDKKTKLFVGCLEAVGWYFDLRYHAWYVVPLRKKIEKMAHYLFNVVPMGKQEIDLHSMQTITGLLCWFSVALPIGKSFVYPLFRCRTDSNGLVFINYAAARDLAFWRALIRVTLVHPHIMGCPIDLLRTTRLPDWFIVSDACTSIGGGSWLSRTPEWIPGNNNLWLLTRWSPAELRVIEARLLCYRAPTDTEWAEVEPSLGHFEIRDEHHNTRKSRSVTINVLEFTQAVLTLLVFAPLLRGCVVDFGVDNTATLCWLVRNRSSPGAADTILKLLSLTCTIYKIKLVVHHVPGAKNILSDWMSRVLGAGSLDPISLYDGFDLTESTAFLAALHARCTNTANPLNRRQVCRLLISHALLCPDDLTAEAIIQMVESLHFLDSVQPQGDIRIPAVIDAYQRLFAQSETPPHIPLELQSALDITTTWNETPLPQHSQRTKHS